MQTFLKYMAFGCYSAALICLGGEHWVAAMNWGLPAISATICRTLIKWEAADERRERYFARKMKRVTQN